MREQARHTPRLREATGCPARSLAIVSTPFAPTKSLAMSADDFSSDPIQPRVTSSPWLLNGQASSESGAARFVDYPAGRSLE